MRLEHVNPIDID